MVKKNIILYVLAISLFIFPHYSYTVHNSTRILYVAAATMATIVSTFLYHHHKLTDTTIPAVTACWFSDQNDDCVKYTATSVHLKPAVFFDLYSQINKKHLVPEVGMICDGHVISQEKLNDLISTLLEEIREKKSEYTDFTILKKNNFNTKNGHGALIVKFKEYPLVLKLFIETPETIVNPFSKDFEELFFYVIGGGINRYFAGFTRIENRERIQQALIDAHMEQEVIVPHKCLWLPPEKSKWNKKIKLVSKNMGEHREITMPYIYGIIAQYVHLKRPFEWFNKDDRARALHISNSINSKCHYLCVDQNIPNYAQTDSGQTVMVDTENFGILVGFAPGEYCFSNYASFWLFCAAKLIKNCFQYIYQLP